MTINTLMVEPSRTEVEQKCHELVAKGNAMFGTNVKLASIGWDLRGRAAGQAMRRNLYYSIRFNLDAKRMDPKHFFNETVPHEIAHLIVFELTLTGRSRDRGHGHDFRRVCRALGGTGNRCHSIDLPKAKVHTKYKYTTDSGRTIEVGAVVHRKIQQGQGRRFKDTGEKVAYNHYVGIA